MAIRVQTIGVGPGVSADLTDEIEGLRFSNTAPGGDEVCTFLFKRQWGTGAPEVAQGNVVRVTEGLSVLWQGFVDELDRAVDTAEAIQVTAYGCGILLKEKLKTEVYVDRDPSAWSDMPFNRRAALGSAVAVNTDYQAGQEAGGLVFNGSDAKAITINSTAELWYTAPQGVTCAKFAYIGSEANTTNAEAVTLFNDDNDTMASAGSNALTLDSTLRSVSPTAERYLMLRARATATHTPAAGSPFRRLVAALAVYSNHGLTTRSIDASTPDGIYVEDIVRDAVSDATGITIARIDSSLVILPHCTFESPTSLEDIVTFVNQFAGYDWGTWGPSSVLDTSTSGYFQFTARDTATAHWYIRRSECDDVSLQVELASLYDTVDVVYTDPKTTGTQIETRTASVQALNDAGRPRETTLDGGVLTQAGAQQLGDKFLDLTSQQPPARGTIRISTNPTHYQRGALPAYYMRADGSTIRVPDVLPSKDALSLSSAPDRRTTFPIKRVEVDCSGAIPVTTVTVDQSDDRLSTLQARLGLAAQYPGAWPITLPH